MTNSAQVFAWLLSAAILSTVPSIAFGQEAPAAMKQNTDGGSLEIMLEPTYTPNDDGSVDAKFKVSFLDPKTETGHAHQDYDFIIRQGGNQIFSAAASLNQPLIHTAETTITIPFKFSQGGDYTAELQLLGLGFPPTPIKPETATFDIVVVPEFPGGLIAVVGAVMVGSIVIGRRYRIF